MYKTHPAFQGPHYLKCNRNTHEITLLTSVLDFDLDLDFSMRTETLVR